ncbi:nitroreductase family protein [Gordonia westfalica]|uniref:Nitroreductase n=1 Tax=Gordonia westfalica TaxID=158898 RepID=A0A1H2GRU4_9ACTN|nr:nitroreductase family protein [Gordonia westfalica]SDU22426.1 Nitroreductase [Gordonia westfalica]
MIDPPIFDTMSTMRAMRRLKPDPVPDEILTELVRAATWAPSGGNTQGYHFVVVTDRARIAELAQLWSAVHDFYAASMAHVTPPLTTAEKHARNVAALKFQCDHFHETPAVIVACYDSGALVDQVRAHFADTLTAARSVGPRRALRVVRNVRRALEMTEAASVYPGVENLLLAARATGLAAAMTTWHLMLEQEFKAVLGIPRRVKTFAIIPIGWPRGRFGPVTRYDPETVIHRDRW